MTYSKSACTTVRRARLAASSSPSAALTTGITVYGCGPDEAALVQKTAARFGVLPTITESALTEGAVGLAHGNRCISVGHKSPITNPTLLALSRAGVEYISTRSIGYNHIDLAYAQRLGLTVGNVTYSPGSVADYTLMLILMAVRHATSMIRRTDAQDYRLGDRPGRELRDLTVGVIGTGRIGSAVIDRLRGFGGRVLAFDNRIRTAAEFASLDDVLRLSDIITLHTPLNADTHHLLDRDRIAQLKDGAVIVNTGRGPLIDTEALITELESGRLGGAALDVLEGEEHIFYRDKPRENTHLMRLQRLSNVLISPHTAYYTDRALLDMVENSLLNCVTFEKGKAI